MMSNHEEIQEDSLRMLNIGRDDEFADSVSNKYHKRLSAVTQSDLHLKVEWLVN